MSCTNGKIMEAIISAGERKNFRRSRSTIAHIRFMRLSSLRLGPADPTGVGVRAYFLVAQLPPRVMDENIVQRGVVHRERLHLDSRLQRHLHHFGAGLRAVT